jgi:hypothetical protein
MFPWSRKARQVRVRVAADVHALLSRARDPYAEARDRMRGATDEVEIRHWSRVAVEIAKATGKQIGLDTGTRMYLKADLSALPPPSRGIAIDSRTSAFDLSSDEIAVLELKRLIGAEMPRFYRFQFLGPSRGHLVNIIEEIDVRVSSLTAAIAKMREVEWPPGALSVRLLDLDGVVLAERERGY